MQPQASTRTRRWSAAVALMALAACRDGTGPRTPAAVAVQAGTPQTAVAGATLADSLVVQVTDADGLPVRNVEVVWSVATGGGTISPASSVTDGSGIAKAAWTLGYRFGAQTAQAAVVGVAGAAQFSAEAGAGNATLAITGLPASAQVGAVLTPVVTVTLNGQPLASAPVTWELAGSGALSATSSTTNAAGQATIAWGATSRGIHFLTARLADSPVHTATASLTITVPQASFTRVWTGEDHSCGLTTAGAAWCWGNNDSGKLGWSGTPEHCPTPTGSSPCRWLPVPVQGGLTFTQLALGAEHTCGLTAAGQVYCWGGSARGQLGRGTEPASAVPVVVTGGRQYTAVAAAGETTCAIATTGQAYCWGSNGAGQVGDGSGSPPPESCGPSGHSCRRNPTLVVGGQTYTALAMSHQITCAINDSNDVHCWGEGYGSSPVLIPGGLKFRALGAGYVTGVGAHFCALTAGNGAYCWGNNSRGQLGDGTTTSSATPVTVAGGHAFSSITGSCGITVSGAAYCWGENTRGRIGDGGTTSSTTPRLVSGGRTWTSISSYLETTCGVASGNQPFCWGANDQAQGGDGTPFDVRTVPTPVGWSGS